jgi:hypothetical protein
MKVVARGELLIGLFSSLGLFFLLSCLLNIAACVCVCRCEQHKQEQYFNDFVDRLTTSIARLPANELCQFTNEWQHQRVQYK